MIYKNGDKKLITDFEELVDIIKSSTSIDIHESAGDKRKRLEYLLSNYEAFCMYYFPEYCFAPMAPFHKGIQSEIADNPNNIFCEQWSRGFAKSTHFGLFLPLFLKATDRLNGVMVGSYNENMAGEKLADIQANLENNQRFINDFGEQHSYGNWEDGAFKTRDDIGFYGFGKGQSPRGTRFKWKRPNYGIVDDLNDARQLKNPAIAQEDKRWVLEELKPALWTRMWWLVIAQNKFHDNTVTALLENDEEIKTVVHQVNIVDANGKSNWTENPDFSQQSIADLQESEGGGFIRERMNTPFEEGTEFKQEWLNEWVEPLPLNQYEAVINYLDPSYKATDKSDFKFWVLLGKHGTKYDILNAWGERTTSKKMWEAAYDLDEEIEDYTTVKHCMEANFIQEEVHGKELDRVAEDKNRMLRCTYDHRAKGDKHERIVTLQPLFQRGLIRFNIHKKQTAGMKLLRSQLLAFEKGSRVNDDGPDALEGAVWMADKAGKRKGNSTRSGNYKKTKKRSI